MIQPIQTTLAFVELPSGMAYATILVDYCSEGNGIRLSGNGHPFRTDIKQFIEEVANSDWRVTRYGEFEYRSLEVTAKSTLHCVGDCISSKLPNIIPLSCSSEISLDAFIVKKSDKDYC